MYCLLNASDSTTIASRKAASLNRPRKEKTGYKTEEMGPETRCDAQVRVLCVCVCACMCTAPRMAQPPCARTPRRARLRGRTATPRIRGRRRCTAAGVHAHCRSQPLIPSCGRRQSGRACGEASTRVAGHAHAGPCAPPPSPAAPGTCVHTRARRRARHPGCACRRCAPPQRAHPKPPGRGILGVFSPKSAPPNPQVAAVRG